MINNYDDVIENYIKEGKLDKVYIEKFENKHDLSIFLYLHYKSLIVNEKYDELNTYFKNPIFYSFSSKILKELIHDQNFFKVFNEEIKKTCYNYIYHARNILEEYDKKQTYKWEELNELIRLIAEKDNLKMNISNENQYYGLMLIYNEMIERNVDIKNKKYVNFFIDNYEQIIYDDYITYILYHFYKNDSLLHEKYILRDALLHLNKIIELDLTYDYKKLYTRCSDEKQRERLRIKKLSRRNF